MDHPNLKPVDVFPLCELSWRAGRNTSRNIPDCRDHRKYFRPVIPPSIL